MEASQGSFLQTQVWGLFLQSVAFGMYIITCVSCFNAFFTRSHQRKLDWPMLAIFLVLFVKVSSSVAIRLATALLLATSPDTAAQSMRNGDPINLAKYTTILVEAAIGSGVLIYRCWLVYSRSWAVVVVPIVLWSGGVALMGTYIHVITTHKIEGLFETAQSRDFGAIFWAIIISINLITSVFIARRVWQIESFKNRPTLQKHTDSSSALPPTKQPCRGLSAGQSLHVHATRIIVDSGLIYTAMSVLTFVFFVANSVAVYASIDVLVPAIGISFNLIVVYNRPQSDDPASYEARMNSVPLQFVSSSISGPGSAIEFAYPKHFMPRRKKTVTLATQEDKEDIIGVAPSPSPSPEFEILQTQSHESL